MTILYFAILAFADQLSKEAFRLIFKVDDLFRPHGERCMEQ